MDILENLTHSYGWYRTTFEDGSLSGSDCFIYNSALEKELRRNFWVESTYDREPAAGVLREVSQINKCSLSRSMKTKAIDDLVTTHILPLVIAFNKEWNKDAEQQKKA